MKNLCSSGLIVASVVCLVVVDYGFCAAAEPTNILVVRHAEKAGEEGDVHLSLAGQKRALALAEMLKPLRVSAIYVTATNRARETAAPLATSLNVSPTTYDFSPAWANSLMQNHPGATVLVIGHSNTVPEIIAHLSGSSVESIGEEYDNLFVVSVAGEKKSAVRLRYGEGHATDAAGLASAVAAGTTLRSLVVEPHIQQVRSLAQNWTEAEAREFYNTAQGARLFPYKWLLHLEQPGMEQNRFLDPDFVRRMGYLPRHSGPGNPDGLPVGFVKDAQYADGSEAVGLTCAACHTNQIEHDGKAYIIDGAPTLADVDSLLKGLEKALAETLQAPKFERFVTAVLGPAPTTNDREKLKVAMQKILQERREYNERNLPKVGSPPFGHGRVDAFGAILNEVTVRFVGETIMGNTGNQRPANAPVSYPFLWDTPHHGVVQWNGAAENNENLLLAPIIGTSQYGALGRNTGEVLGVFGHADLRAENGILGGYASTVRRENLVRLEELVRTLWSPQWPAELGPIDPDKRESGAVLYQQHCASCHALIDRQNPAREANEMMKSVGTDSTMARNFATREAKTGGLEGRELLIFNPFNRIGPTASGKDLLTHVVLRVILGPESTTPGRAGALPALAKIRLSIPAEVFSEGVAVEGRFASIELDGDRVKSLVAESTEASGANARLSPARLKGFARSATPEGVRLVPTAEATIRFQYKARPLNGIWATAPYLHNGSVPNIAELLLPPANRSVKFKVGSRKFDPLGMGFVASEGPFEYDTSLPGNSNSGHEYATGLNAAQREQLIEFLKAL